MIRRTGEVLGCPSAGASDSLFKWCATMAEGREALTEGKARYNPMGKAEVRQSKKSDGCTVARKSLRGDGAKASCLGEVLNLLEPRR